MYSAVVLDEKSQLKLEKWAENNVKVNGVRLPILVQQNGWRMYCHHMTINMGPLPEYLKAELGQPTTLEAVSLGISDKAIAVKVVGTMAGHSKNATPHITLSVSPDGKPVMSNKITEWSRIDPIVLKGTIQEVQ